MEKAIFKSLSSILWIVMVWAGIYAFLVYKDMRFAPESYVVQIFLATAFFLSSMVSVPFNEERVLVLRLLNKEIKTLESGTYFYPFLGFWGKIYIPPEYRGDSKVIHIDTRLMRTHEIKTWKGDLLVSFMTYFFPMAKKFSFWNLMFCLVLGTGAGYGAVKIKREHFPDATQSAKVTKMQIIKKELARSIQGLPSQNETSQNSTSSTPQKSSSDHVSQTYTSPQIPSQTQSQASPKNEENNSSVSSSSNSRVWQPNKPFYDNFTWDNLTANDKYSAIASIPKSVSSVNVRGTFTNSYYSKNYFPAVYVDGFEGDNSFFCNFFKVYIRKITLKNGQTWFNTEIELCAYIDFLKSGQVDNECFRDVKISLKPQFAGKYRWHLVDAGWGRDRSNMFKIYLEDGQYITSLRESETWGIVRSETEGEGSSSQSQSSTTQPERKSELAQRQESSRTEDRNVTNQDYDSFVRNSNITFVPHRILRGYSDVEISQYLYQDYYFTGLKVVDGEDVFRIVDRYDNVVSEMYCFRFIFAYKGKLYDSYDKSVYRGQTTNSMLRDAHISANLPDNVYIINGRAFHFYGYPYNP